LPKFKKKRRSSTGDGDEPRKKRKTKKAARTPSPELELTPEERRKKELNDRLDAIIKKPKAKKKKRGADEEVNILQVRLYSSSLLCHRNWQDKLQTKKKS
jgi:hypothetical protein